MLNFHAYEAAAKLQSAELKPFYDWLKTERVDVLERLSVARPELVGVLQGEAQRLEKILDFIDSARAVVERKQ
jgi:hypothetical protein